MAEKNSVLKQIMVAVVVALLVGGSAPWWWQELSGSDNQKKNSSQQYDRPQNEPNDPNRDIQNEKAETRPTNDNADNKTPQNNSSGDCMVEIWIGNLQSQPKPAGGNTITRIEKGRYSVLSVKKVDWVNSKVTFLKIKYKTTEGWVNAKAVHKMSDTCLEMIQRQ